MYALGMTVRDIQGHLHDMYGVEVSPALISQVTDSIQDEVKAYEDRPLEVLYPIVYLDAADGENASGWQGRKPGCLHDGNPASMWKRQKSVLGLWVSCQ